MTHISKITPATSLLFCNRITYSKAHSTADINAICLIDLLMLMAHSNFM